MQTTYEQHIVPEIDAVTITFEVSNKCNYKCSYCVPDLNAGTFPWPDRDRALEFVNGLASKHSSVCLDLAGGEPTQWPKLKSFLNGLAPNVSTEIISNGSRTLSYWKRLQSDLTSLSISYHPEYADDEHIVELVSFLQDTADLHVNLMFDLNHRDRVLAMYDRLLPYRTSIEIKPIMPGWSKMLPYTDEDKVLMARGMRYTRSRLHQRPKSTTVLWNGERVRPTKDIVLTKRNHFTGWHCYAGSKRFLISSNGSIFAGSCRAKLLGSLTDGWQYETDPIICQRNVCWCRDDIRTEKFKK